MAPTIAVLDASIGETHAERNLTRELPAKTDLFKVSEGELPERDTIPVAYDGIVISGSQVSVYDGHAWIDQLTTWFRYAHRQRIPTLGICWGHQFIASALGGRVVDMGEYELGYRAIERFGTDPVLGQLPAEFIAFETHSDRVIEIPSHGIPLAGNDYGLQSYRVGTALGVQFHPEYDRETVVELLKRKDSVEETRLQQARRSVTEDNVKTAQTATAVFDGFVEYVTQWTPQQAAELDVYRRE